MEGSAECDVPGALARLPHNCWMWFSVGGRAGLELLQEWKIFFVSSSNIRHILKKANVAEETRATRETGYIIGNERTRMATKTGCPVAV